MNKPEYFDHVFANKLDHKWGNPRILGVYDTRQILLPYVTITMPGHEAINQFSL
jgi:hypothetical protein